MEGLLSHTRLRFLNLTTSGLAPLLQANQCRLPRMPNPLQGSTRHQRILVCFAAVAFVMLLIPPMQQTTWSSAGQDRVRFIGYGVLLDSTRTAVDSRGVSHSGLAIAWPRLLTQLAVLGIAGAVLSAFLKPER